MKKTIPNRILFCLLGLFFAGCPESGEPDEDDPGGGGDKDSDGTSDEVNFGDGNTDITYTDITDDMPAAGYADGACPVPEEAMPEDDTPFDYTGDLGAFTLMDPSDNTEVFTSIAAGSYDVTARADGYVWQTITGVAVISDTITVQDFALQPALQFHLQPVLRNW